MTKKDKAVGHPVGKRHPKADGTGYEDGKDYQPDGWGDTRGTYNKPVEPLPKGVEGVQASPPNRTARKNS